MLLPGGTPQPIADTLNGWIGKIQASPDTQAFFRLAGADVFPGTPQDLTRLQREEISKWAELMKLAEMEAQ